MKKSLNNNDTNVQTLCVKLVGQLKNNNKNKKLSKNCIVNIC